jgi:hypothetical protein
MPFKCKQAFLREEKCLLDHLVPFWDFPLSVLQSFRAAASQPRKELSSSQVEPGFITEGTTMIQMIPRGAKEACTGWQHTPEFAGNPLEWVPGKPSKVNSAVIQGVLGENGC